MVLVGPIGAFAFARIGWREHTSERCEELLPLASPLGLSTAGPPIRTTSSIVNTSPQSPPEWDLLRLGEGLLVLAPCDDRESRPAEHADAAFQ